MDFQKQKQIKNTSLKLFVKNGYHTTTINNIAYEAGISKGLIYYYFKSKDEIIQTIVRDSIQQILNEFDLFTIPVHSIELSDLFLKTLDILNFNIPFWKLSFQIISDPYHFSKQYEQIYQQIDKPFHKQLMDFFKYKKSDNPEADSYFYITLINGVFYNALFKQKKFHYKSIEQLNKIITKF